MNFLNNLSINVPAELYNNLVYNNFFNNLQGEISTLTGYLRGISLTVIILCITITGIMFLMGEEMSRNAKKWLMYIVVGAVLIFAATTLGNTLQGLADF